MKKRVLIINEIYSDNIGDQAIAASMLSFFKSPEFEIDLQDFSFRKEISSGSKKNKKISFFLNVIFLKRFYFTVKNLKQIFTLKYSKYDLIIIGGGQLILGNIFFPLSIYLFSFVLKNKNNKIKVVSVGVGSQFSFFDKAIIKKALNHIDEIYVRDIKSGNNLKKIFHRDSEVIPDMVYINKKSKFSIKQKEESNLIVSPVNKLVYDRYKSEVSNPSLDEIGYTKMWLHIIKENIRYFNIETIILSPTSMSDYDFSLKIFKILKNEGFNVKLKTTNNYKDFMKLISGSKSLLSGRMHALIFGHIMDLEIFPFVISSKISQYNKEYLMLNPESLRNKLLAYKMQIFN